MHKQLFTGAFQFWVLRGVFKEPACSEVYSGITPPPSFLSFASCSSLPLSLFHIQKGRGPQPCLHGQMWRIWGFSSINILALVARCCLLHCTLVFFICFIYTFYLIREYGTNHKDQYFSTKTLQCCSCKSLISTCFLGVGNGDSRNTVALQKTHFVHYM